jgi:hypothetical protein
LRWFAAKKSWKLSEARSLAISAGTAACERMAIFP